MTSFSVQDFLAMRDGYWCVCVIARPQFLDRLGNARTAEDVQDIMEAIRQWYDDDKLAELQRALVIWLKRVLLPARLPGIEIPQMLQCET